MLKLLFWALVALDVLGVLFFFAPTPTLPVN